MAHAVLDLWVPESVAGHGDELLRPQVNNVGDLARGHYDTARKCKPVVLQELVLLEAPFQQDFRVVSDDVGLALAVKRAHSLRAQIPDLIIAEKYALAVKVRQNVVRANELHPPVKRIENVGLLSHELAVSEGHIDVLEQLLDAWVGHLVILG